MQNSIYIYILVMAVVTYFIRVLPLTLIKKEITNRHIRSFLYYMPYVTLAVMTFPSILHATDSIYAGWAGMLVAILLAWKKQSLFCVSAASCLVVFILELII